MKKNEFFANLPEELKEKLKSCRTEAEMNALLKGAQIELPDELLEGVSGGWTPHLVLCSTFRIEDCGDYYQPQEEKGFF